MNFFRSNFKHKRTIAGYNRGAGSGQEIPIMEEIDEQKMDFFPPAFFELLDHSYRIEDSFVAASLCPEEPITEDQAKLLKLFLAAAGFPVDQLEFSDHYEFVHTLLGNCDDFARVQQEASEANILEESFSFCSMNFEKACNFLAETLEELGTFILLFFTPLGFAYYTPPGAANWSRIFAGVVVSHRQILNLDPQLVNFRIRTPCRDQREATSLKTPRPICSFSIVDGQWQPSVSQDMLSFIVRDLNANATATIDGTFVDFSKFSEISGIFVGLIGRYSDILKLFEGDEKEYNALSYQMQSLVPQLFFLRGVHACSYLVLYLPRDFMPNHPQYREVAAYAYTVMKRCCTMTLFVPSSAATLSGKIDNHVHGILKQANATEIVFHGSGSTQILTMKSDPVVSTMAFSGVSDFFKWMEWLQPAYGFEMLNQAASLVSGSVYLNEEVVTRLLFQRNCGTNWHAFEELFYGPYGNRKPEEVTAEQLKDTTRCNIPGLLEKAARLTARAAEATPLKRCAICDSLERPMTAKRKKELLETTGENLLCPQCIRDKLELTNPPNAAQGIKSQNNMIRAMEASKGAYMTMASELYTMATTRSNGNETGVFFLEWFWHYWVSYCLKSSWDKLQQGNRLGLRDFDMVEFDEKGLLKDMFQAINHLSGKGFTEKNANYYSFLAEICLMCPQVLDREQMFGDFQVSLLERNRTMQENRSPLPYSEIEKRFANVGLPQTTRIGKNIGIASLRVAPDLKVLVETNVPKFMQYTFHRVIVSTEESYCAQPLFGEVVATLVEQPEDMVIVNSWNVSSGVLVLTAIGNRLRLVFLENNFYGRCVDDFVYEAEISRTDDIFAEYAPVANMLFLVFSTEKDRYMTLIQLSLDFLSSTEVRRRPLRFLLPLYGFFNPGLRLFSQSDEEADTKWEPPVFHGFIVDESATHGVISVSLPQERAPNRLVDFDPMTLSVLELQHRVSDAVMPMLPLHFHKKKEPFDTVVCCSKDPNREGYHEIYICRSGDRPKTRIVQIPLKEHGEIRSKIGVGQFSKNPIITMSGKDQPPTFQTVITKHLPCFPDLDDMFSVNFDYDAIPKFVSECIAKYGLSEIERLAFPTRSPYPVELAKMEVLCPEGNRCRTPIRELTESIKVSMPSAIPLNWSCPLAVYDAPQHAENAGLFFSLFNAKEKAEYKVAITFLFRLMSLPRVLISSIPKPVKSLGRYTEQVISALAASLKTTFQPLPAMRVTSTRPCSVISLVDIGEADGSSILSSLTGVPFTSSTKGTFRVGSNFCPIFDPKAPSLFCSDHLTIDKKSVTRFQNVMCCALKSDRPNSIESNVIALYTAVACSDLVIVNAGKDIESLIAILRMFIKFVSRLDTEIGHLLPESYEDFSCRFAFVTDLGANMEMTVEKLNNIIGSELGLVPNTDTEVCHAIFANECTYVHCKLSPFEISRAIAQSQLVKIVDSWTSKEVGEQLQTGDALVRVFNAAGMFGGMLSYIDYFMETGVIDDNEEAEDQGSGGEDEDEEE